MVPIRPILAVVTFVIAGVGASFASAPSAYACSPLNPQPSVEEALRSSDVVVSGYVNDIDAPGNGLVALSVEEWFHGDDPVDSLTIVTGKPESCGLALAGIGEPVILAARREGDRIIPGVFLPNAQLFTPEGDALVATARSIFGAPIRPGCWPHRPLAAFVNDWGNFPDDDVTPVVVAGTVTEHLGIVDDAGTVSYRFAVEQWFPGPDGYAEIGLGVGQMPDRSGKVATLTVGQRLVLAGGLEGGRLGFVDCLPHAALGSPEADTLLADAREIFGEPVVPPPDRKLPVSDGSGFGIAMLMMFLFGNPIGLLLVALIVFVPLVIAVAVLVRRRLAGRED